MCDFSRCGNCSWSVLYQFGIRAFAIFSVVVCVTFLFAHSRSKNKTNNQVPNPSWSCHMSIATNPAGRHHHRPSPLGLHLRPTTTTLPLRLAARQNPRSRSANRNFVVCSILRTLSLDSPSIHPRTSKIDLLHCFPTEFHPKSLNQLGLITSRIGSIDYSPIRKP